MVEQGCTTIFWCKRLGHFFKGWGEQRNALKPEDERAMYPGRVRASYRFASTHLS